MRSFALAVLLLIASLALSGEPKPSAAAAPSPLLRFFAVGDLPYSQSEMEPLRDLMAEGAAGGTPFVVHVGDIKSGSSPCTDEGLSEVAALFRAQSVPVVYSVGDNEWTDCHRKSAGGLSPLVRLKRVREMFFGDPGVLKLAALSPVRDSPAYPEIYAFLRNGVLVAALHVVGSNNGYDRSDTVASAEFVARDAENRRFLKRLLESPQGRNARALVLAIQADPLFENGAGPVGFKGFKLQLADLMGTFKGSVLVLHGDTHRFRKDQPLLDPKRGAPFDRLWRIEVPGSPIVGGVWISVDPSAAEPFQAHPVYAVSLRRIESP